MFFRDLWLVMIFWEEIVPGNFILIDGRVPHYAAHADVVTALRGGHNNDDQLAFASPATLLLPTLCLPCSIMSRSVYLGMTCLWLSAR